jgi:hypothetical protein
MLKDIFNKKVLINFIEEVIRGICKLKGLSGGMIRRILEI